MMHPQEREWLVFDDRGATWAARSLELKRRLSCFHHDGDLAAYLVRNLGFVAGRSLGRNAAIRLRLQLVSEVALAAAFYWLADHDPRRVLIDFAGESRPCEVRRSAAAAIARLIELTQPHNLSRYAVAEKQSPLNQIASTIVAAR
jgi:hypothetical protein